ncbi:MAG: cupin domain-containing protein [Oscillospiraceae bacterium]
MSYKINRKNESDPYEAPGHFKVHCTHLHIPPEVNEGKLVMGLSHFLPGGGCEFGAPPLETIYYVLCGEMTVKTEDGEFTLHEGDSFHSGKGTGKSILNTGTDTCKLLVCLLPPEGAPPVHD